jgi:hypothetical protein
MRGSAISPTVLHPYPRRHVVTSLTPSHPLTCPPINPPIYLSTYLPIYLPTSIPTHSPNQPIYYLIFMEFEYFMESQTSKVFGLTLFA